MDKIYDVFVPGCVCLFGEHTDWAGGCRRVNSSIRPGGYDTGLPGPYVRTLQAVYSKVGEGC